MTKQVLDVGQCAPDHISITRLLQTHFDAKVSRAHSQAETILLCTETNFDLILINRVLDADGSAGLSILKALKANSETQAIPVMIVSNFAEAQMAAVQAGAVPGFGKSSLNSPKTLAELKKYLDHQ